MNYFSTRDKSLKLNFKEIFLRGLAPGGGLFLPIKIKRYTKEDLKNLSQLNYKDLATEIIFNFCSKEINKKELSSLIEKSYKALSIDGYLALYITDFKGASYISDMKNYVKANLKEQLRYEGDIHWLNKEPPKKIRTIYVWKKII